MISDTQHYFRRREPTVTACQILLAKMGSVINIKGAKQFIYAVLEATPDKASRDRILFKLVEEGSPYKRIQLIASILQQSLVKIQDALDEVDLFYR